VGEDASDAAIVDLDGFDMANDLADILDDVLL